MFIQPTTGNPELHETQVYFSIICKSSTFDLVYKGSEVQPSLIWERQGCEPTVI